MGLGISYKDFKAQLTKDDRTASEIIESISERYDRYFSQGFEKMELLENGNI